MATAGSTGDHHSIHSSSSKNAGSRSILKSFAAKLASKPKDRPKPGTIRAAGNSEIVAAVAKGTPPLTPHAVAERIKSFGSDSYQRDAKTPEVAAASAGTPVPDDGTSACGSPVSTSTDHDTPDSKHVEPGFSASRMAKFHKVIAARTVDIDELSKLSWHGIPKRLRPEIWQLLLGYLPSNKERQASTLKRKRAEYHSCVEQHFGSQSSYRTEKEQVTLRDVVVDLPRTCPGIPLFHTEYVQKALEHVLYIWGVRHPASGYVQGINDIAMPFFSVFLSPYADLDTSDLSALDDQTKADIEADVYWCLSNLLDGIQDRYTFSQPGIQRAVFQLKELLARINLPLHNHIVAEGLEFMQITFRIVNCLLLREIPHRQVIRLWDTLLSEPQGFDTFFVYVCAAFVQKFQEQILARHADAFVLFWQSFPTSGWSVADVESLVSQAFVYKSLYEEAKGHFQ